MVDISFPLKILWYKNEGVKVNATGSLGVKDVEKKRHLKHKETLIFIFVPSVFSYTV